MPKSVTFGQCQSLIKTMHLPCKLIRMNGIYRLYMDNPVGIVYANPERLWDRLLQMEEEMQETAEPKNAVDLQGKSIEERTAIAVELSQKGSAANAS